MCYSHHHVVEEAKGRRKKIGMHLEPVEYGLKIWLCKLVLDKAGQLISYELQHHVK